MSSQDSGSVKVPKREKGEAISPSSRVEYAVDDVDHSASLQQGGAIAFEGKHELTDYGGPSGATAQASAIECTEKTDTLNDLEDIEVKCLKKSSHSSVSNDESKNVSGGCSSLDSNPSHISGQRLNFELRSGSNEAEDENRGATSDETEYASDHGDNGEAVQLCEEPKEIQGQCVIPEREQGWELSSVMVAPKEQSITATLLSNAGAEQVISNPIVRIHTQLDSYFSIPITADRGHSGLFVIDKPLCIILSLINSEKDDSKQSSMIVNGKPVIQLSEPTANSTVMTGLALNTIKPPNMDDLKTISKQISQSRLPDMVLDTMKGSSCMTQGEEYKAVSGPATFFSQNVGQDLELIDNG